MEFSGQCSQEQMRTMIGENINDVWVKRHAGRSIVVYNDRIPNKIVKQFEKFWSNRWRLVRYFLSRRSKSSRTRRYDVTYLLFTYAHKNIRYVNRFAFIQKLEQRWTDVIYDLSTEHRNYNTLYSENISLLGWRVTVLREPGKWTYRRVNIMILSHCAYGNSLLISLCFGESFWTLLHL